jgi:beta-phosphoglucomutase-like phosphatase (HAD superfamily)
MNTPNPQDPHVHSSYASGTTPFDTSNVEAPDDTLATRCSEGTLRGRSEYGSSAVESAAIRLELEPGLSIPDGRIFTKCLSRQDRFIIPSNTQALILDFDGTTAPFNLSEGIRQKAFRKVILEVLSSNFAATDPDRKVHRDDIERCHNPAIGHPERTMSSIISEHLREHYQINVNPDDVFSRWVDYTGMLSEQVKGNIGTSGRATIVPGVARILLQAADRGIPVAICSNGDGAFVPVLSDAIGVSPLIHPKASVYTSCYPHIKPKPSSDPYLLTCEKLGVDPSKVVIAEDSATGALAGLRAGGLVLLQPSGRRYDTIKTLHDCVQADHQQWFEERQGRVVLFAAQRGFRQAEFE